jgi:hypothetical protein
MNIHLWVIDHRGSYAQVKGKVIIPWRVFPDDIPGPRYADFTALYEVWRQAQLFKRPIDIVGFMGYRKYFIFPEAEIDVLQDTEITPAHNKGWYQCPLVTFDYYRRWLANWDGAGILPLLATHDIITAPPYQLNESVWDDFATSRSSLDAHVLHYLYPDGGSRKITPYLFITRWSVFDRMMEELEPYRKVLDTVITAKDSRDEAYKKRPMAYVMERLFSIWLEQSGLSTYEMPLLHCWELQ